MLHSLFTATLLLQSATYTNAASCVTDKNICDGPGEAYRPLPFCKDYAYCIDNKVSQFMTCNEGSIFDVLLKRCNWEYVSFCIVQSCPPAPAPSASPSESPTAIPSSSPSDSPTDSPSSFPSASPTETPSSTPSSSPTNSPVRICQIFAFEIYVICSATAYHSDILNL